MIGAYWQTFTIIKQERSFRSLIFLSILQGLLPICLILLTKYLIDSYLAGDIKRFLGVLIFEFLILLLMGFLKRITNHFSFVAGELLGSKLRVNMASKTMSMPQEFLEEPKNQSLIHRALRESGHRFVAIAHSTSGLITELITTFSLVAALVIVNTWYIVPSALFLVITIFLFSLASRRVYDTQLASTPYAMQASYFENIAHGIGFSLDIRLFAMNNWIKGKISDSLSRSYEIRRDGNVKNLKLYLIIEALSVALSYGVIIFATNEAFGQGKSVGDVMLILGALAGLRNSASNIVGNANLIHESVRLASSLFEYLSTPSVYCDTNEDGTVKIDTSTALHEIRLENVSFAYPGRGECVFDCLSLRLDLSKTTALVGHNGSGKSTLVKLIMRLYDPKSGAIYLDDININTLSLTQYRARFSCILQDYSQFDASVQENVTLSKNFDSQDLNIALEFSGTREIRSIKDPKQQLGRLFDPNGQQISPGQWQKLVLARAIYRKPRYYILDEPTSALDPISEKEIIDIISDRHKIDGALVVTHRILNLKKFDRILVMKNKLIVEDGKFDELIDYGGEFYRMYIAQTEGLRS